MDIEEQNNHYHYILSILKNNNSEQAKATDILLYMEQVINNKELEMQANNEEYGSNSMGLPPPKFGKTFKRVT
jgi:hypothetical protein